MATRSPAPSRATRDGPRTATLPHDESRKVTYAEYGAPDGVPVVFLHGTPGSRRLGRLLDTPAEECGVRVLAPDRPGYGRSSPWPDRSIADAGTVVTAVLDDAGVETAGLVGFSGGSAHALATAATHPDRVTRVDIVAGATPPAVSEETPGVQRLLARLATTTPSVLGGLFRGQAWLADRFDPSLVVAQYTADGDTEPLPEQVTETVGADFVEAFRSHRSGAVTELRNTATAWDIDFAAVETAVCLWHGEDDTNVLVGDARRLHGVLPNAELRVLDGVDHLGTLLGCVPSVLERHV
jgi:pimeloyl-ACP methyl ester carboxylesterase